MSEPEDPTRRFLDQTVPKHDEWDGREPEDGPARPRHVQHPVEPVEPLSTKERRANTIRNVAWGVGPSAAFIAGAALADDDTDPAAEPRRQDPDRNGRDSSSVDDSGFSDSGYGDSGYGEAGSGW